VRCVEAINGSAAPQVPGNPAAPPGGAIETKEPKNQRNGDILPQVKIQTG
jgi:hypothetical protein